jgi:hypothetical protein
MVLVNRDQVRRLLVQYRHGPRPVVENPSAVVRRAGPAVQRGIDAVADAALPGKEHVLDAGHIGKIVGCNHAAIIDETAWA